MSIHNLRAADYNIKGDFSDWGVSQSYYSMYHSLLAVLFKLGYESKNHECTINAVEYLIELLRRLKLHWVSYDYFLELKHN